MKRWVVILSLLFAGWVYANPIGSPISGPGSGVSQLNDLSDVTISSPSNDESMMYSATAGKWVNKASAGSGDMTKAVYDTDADSDIDLAAGGTNASLVDPNADELMGWDDTDNAIVLMTLGSGLAYNATTDTLSSSGGSAPIAGTNISVSGQTVSMVANLDGAYINESTMDAALLGGTIGSDQLAADVARDSELFGGNFSDLAGSATDSQIPDNITISAIPAANITGSIADAQIVAAIARDSELFGGNFSDLAGSITDAQTPDDVTILSSAISGNITSAQIDADMARDSELFGGNFSDLAGSITDAQLINLENISNGGTTASWVLATDGAGDSYWKVDATGGGGANSFETWNVENGTDPVADSATDTILIYDGAGITVTGDATADSITIAYSGAFSGVAGSVSDSQVPDSITVTTITATADSVTQGKVEVATRAETETGTSQVLAVSPDALEQWSGSTNITTLGTVTSGTIGSGASVVDAALPAAGTFNSVGVTTATIDALNLTSVCATDQYRLVWNTGNAVSCVAAAGGGDMNTSTYDIDTDGDIDQAAGGTELDTSAVTSGQLLIGNTTGNVWSLGTLTPVANETDVTNADGSITIGIVASPTLDATNITGGDIHAQVHDNTDHSTNYAVSGGAEHDGFSDFVTAEHLTPGAGLAQNAGAIDIDANILAGSHSAAWFTPVATDDNMVVFRATGAGTISEVECYTTGGTNTIINVYKNAADVSNGNFTCGAGAWASDTALTNATFVDDDVIQVDTISISGTPSKVFVQVNFDE